MLIQTLWINIDRLNHSVTLYRDIYRCEIPGFDLVEIFIFPVFLVGTETNIN